jgi:hypothetical protein
VTKVRRVGSAPSACLTSWFLCRNCALWLPMGSARRELASPAGPSRGQRQPMLQVELLLETFVDFFAAELDAGPWPGVLSRPLHGPDPGGVAAAAEEPVLPVGLESGHMDPGRHVHALQYLAGARVDAAQLAGIVFPGGMP